MRFVSDTCLAHKSDQASAFGLMRWNRKSVKLVGPGWNIHIDLPITVDYNFTLSSSVGQSLLVLLLFLAQAGTKTSKLAAAAIFWSALSRVWINGMAGRASGRALLPLSLTLRCL